MSWLGKLSLDAPQHGPLPLVALIGLTIAGVVGAVVAAGVITYLHRWPAVWRGARWLSS